MEPDEVYFICRYDSTTGTFTVPSGGDGYYYFSVFLVVNNDEFGRFDIQINGETLCSPYGDQHDTPGDPGQVACGATTYAVTGLLFSTFLKYTV